MPDRTRRAVERPAAATPTSTMTSPIPLAAAFGGYVLAWFGGQVLGGLVALGSETGDERPIAVLFAAVAMTWIVYLGALWWLSKSTGTGDPRADYAVSFRPIDLLGVPIGVLLQVAVVPLLYVPLRAVWPDTFSVDELSEYAEDLVGRANGAEIALLVLMVAILAPIVEELVYRGLLHRSLARTLPPALAVVASGALFALIHFRPIEYPGLFIVGIVLAAGVAWTGRLGMAIVTHVAFNATGLIVVAG